MGSVKDYFSSLGKGISSLFKGLEVTGKEFVTPKITERYPENRDDMHVAQRFRASLQFIYDAEGNHRCIACGTCERNCPNGTINIETKMVDTWDGKKEEKARPLFLRSRQLHILSALCDHMSHQRHRVHQRFRAGCVHT